MAETTSPHVGDVGTIFEGTFYDGGVIVDISAATTKEILFRKPDGTVVTKTGTFSTDGTDGKLRYTTIAGDLDQAGDWRVQGYIVTPTGSWKSSVETFTVLANLA
jgi:hypothetical protein